MIDPREKRRAELSMGRYIYDYFSCSGRFAVPGLRVLMCECPCGGLTFYTVVDPDLAARRGRFLGQVLGTCESCGDKRRFLSVLPEHPDTGGQIAKVLKCDCDNQTFYLAIGELFDEGFFDMGIVAAQCTTCARPRVVVETD